ALGSRLMLISYLAGASLMCLAVHFAVGVPMLMVVMFLMGSFASLYHPAGLAYISHISGPKDVGQALGYHGIVGALGIAGAPFIAGTLLNWISWSGVYLSLAPVGLLLAAAFWCFLPPDPHVHRASTGAISPPSNWLGFALV